MRVLFALAMLLAPTAASLAATCTSQASGNWNAGATWAAGCGANGPVAGDTVNIGTTGAHTVTVPAGVTANAATITIGATGTNGPAVLILDPACTASPKCLNLTGAMTINNPANNNNTNEFTVGAGSATVASLAITGGAANRLARATISTGTLTVTGNVTFNNTNARIVFSSTGTLEVGGSLGAGGTLTPSTGTVSYNGGGAQTVQNGYAYNNLAIDKSGGSTATPGGTLFIGGNLTVNAGILNLNTTTNTANRLTAGGSITVANGATLQLGSTNSFPTNYATHTLGATSTVEYNGAAQAVTAETYGNLVITGNATTKTAAGGTWSAVTDLTINSGATFDVNTNDPTLTVGRNMTVTGTYTGSNTASLTLSGTTGTLSVTGTYTGNGGALSLSGNFTQSGTFASGAGVVTFTGTAAQTWAGTTATTITNLTINKASNGVSITTQNQTVSGTLTLQAGAVTTGSQILIVSNNAAAAVVRTSGYVIGNLRRAFPTGANVSRAFDVGTGTSYTPVTVTFASIGTAGSLTVSSTATAHPNINTSGIDPNFALTRYWTLTNVGIVFTNYSATFTFINPGDISACPPPSGTDCNPANFIVQRFSGGTWNSTTIGTRNSADTTATGITGFGDFQIGEARPSAGASSFNAVEVGAGVLTNIRTKVAGATFSLDLVALNAARNAANTAFKGPVTVELLNSSDNSGGLDANGCRNTWVSIQSFTTTFAASESGRHTTSFTESNIFPDARVRVKYTIAGTDLLIGCSIDNFAVRPSTFDSVAASDLDWENPGTTRNLTNTATSGGAVHKAGRDFTVSARALNGAGTPAVMTTYAGTPVAVTTVVTPAGGANGSLTFGSWTASSGTVTSTNATFSEAGVVTMRLEDQSYANVDASDGVSTTADRYVVGPNLNIGRFVPDHFTFTSPNTPALQTFGSTCVGARSFTYVGQSFWYATLPSATIEARNVGNTVTTNYRGTLFKLTASGIGETYSNNAVGPTLIVGASVSPPQLSTGNGTGTYTAKASATDVNLTYTRDAATPIVPFTANISLTVTASDSSESAFSGNGTITAASSLVFNSIAFDAGSEFRYGRMRLLNAAGPTTVDIPLTLRAEYYLSAAAGFVTNNADNCTPLATGNFKLSGHAGSLNGTDVAVSVPARLASGVASGMKLTKSTTPVNGPGLVRVCFDLDSAPAAGDTTCAASTSANRAYLQGPWSSAGTYNKDPTGQVNVGTFGAQPDNFIFFRENY